MHYIYIIKSKKNNSLYIGRTQNLKNRLREHNAGEGFTTKKYGPWVLVYFEGYALEKDAKQREHNLKYFGKVYSQLKRRITNSIDAA
jgi:putative endonuclease